VTVLWETRGYVELRGELTNELGRDRTASFMSVQILRPSAPSPELTPQISYAAANMIEAASPEEIGLIQRNG